MAQNPQTGRLPANPGVALKALRNKRGWTLAEVADRTGLTVSTLSKVENGRIALTFDKLVRLSEGLEVDITQLIGAGAKPYSSERATRRSITRAGEGRSIEMPRGNYLYLASELLNKQIVPIYGEVITKEIAGYGEYMQHPGEEFVYVLEGTLELHTEMYTPARLEVGDSVYFDSSLRHAYIAVGDKPCRILSICTTAEHHLQQALGEMTTSEALTSNPPAVSQPRTKQRSTAKAPAIAKRVSPRQID